MKCSFHKLVIFENKNVLMCFEIKQGAGCPLLGSMFFRSVVSATDKWSAADVNTCHRNVHFCKTFANIGRFTVNYIHLHLRTLADLL